MSNNKLFKTIATVGGAAAYLYLQNTWIEKTHYAIAIEGLEPENEGLKIAHLSDLHMPNTQIDFDKLVQMLEEEEPDFIFLTGDQVDAADAFRLAESVPFFKKLTKIAPTYAVNGNHDINSPNGEQLPELYGKSGVTFLDDEAYSVLANGRRPVVIMGVSEPSRLLKKQIKHPLRKVSVRPDWEGQTMLLLAHHPEDFSKYHTDPNKAPDLTFSGHAHGGQIRIPFVGGLFAPGQGKMPQHTSGVVYSEINPDKKLVISRGLGPSQFPFRINNRPELVMVTLHQKR